MYSARPPRILSALLPGLLLAAALFAGCDLVRSLTGGTPDLAAPADSGTVPTIPQPGRDDEELADALRAHVQGLDSAALATCFHADRLRTFYERRGWRPVWTGEDGWPDEALRAMETLDRASSFGLNPDAFHASTLHRLLRSAGRGDAAAWPALEWLLSDGAVAYARSLRYGAVNPRRADPAGYFLPVEQPSSSSLLSVLQETRPGEALGQLAPADDRSAALREALLRVAALAHTRVFPTVPPPEKDRLAPGDRSRIFRAAALRLSLSGDLTEGMASWSGVSGPADILSDLALRISPHHPAHAHAIPYDSALARGLRRFQARNGLLPDGVVGARTIALLNRPPGDLLRSIAVNMERCRWLQLPRQGRYVRVNIPEFHLYACDGDRVVTDMKICCGQARSPYFESQWDAWQRSGSARLRPVNFETPQITGAFRLITINPVWYVPPIIARKELLYSARKDSTFLRRKKYRVFLRDSLVAPEKVNWRAYSETNLPFRISQDPGEYNALGRLKFTFDNPFSIYLHDTPLRSAFGRARRDVSHGCMRVEKPLAFVAYLLHGKEGWTAGRVQQLVWQNVHSRPLRLAEHPPLFVDYCTAWVDSTGALQFRDDVYRKDRRVSRSAVSPRGISTLAFAAPAPRPAPAPAPAPAPVPVSAPIVKAPAATVPAKNAVTTPMPTASPARTAAGAATSSSPSNTPTAAVPAKPATPAVVPHSAKPAQAVPAKGATAAPSPEGTTARPSAPAPTSPPPKPVPDPAAGGGGTPASPAQTSP